MSGVFLGRFRSKLGARGLVAVGVWGLDEASGPLNSVSDGLHPEAMLGCFAMLPPVFPLDFVFRGGGSEGIADTAALVQEADELGISRYWIGEHHLRGAECPEPSLLAAVLAGCTSQITVGVTSTLMAYRSPLLLANSYLTLERLFPGRVEVAVVPSFADHRANHDYLLDVAMAGDTPSAPSGRMDPMHFSQRVSDMLTLMREHELPASHPHAGTVAEPVCDQSPRVLATGGWAAARLAAEHGLPLAISLIHGAPDGPFIEPSVELVRFYRSEFRPSWFCEKPEVFVAVAGVVDESASGIEDRMGAWRGRVGGCYRLRVNGSWKDAAAELEAIGRRYGADAIAFLDANLDVGVRRRNMVALCERGMSSKYSI